MPTKVNRRKTEELIKALSHPIRLSVLQILGERVASPNEIARQTGEHVTTISYHVKVLREAECIELVETQPRRGATEHYYRAMERGHFSDEDWNDLPQEKREEISALVRQELFVQIFGAQEERTFDSRRDRHLSWAPMNLDNEGFGELVQLLTNTLEASFEIQAKSTARMADGKEAGKPAVIALMGFEAASRKPFRPRSKR